MKRNLLCASLALVLFSLSASGAEGAVRRQPTIIHSVPFTSQAPYAEWRNPIFEYGCEEASMIMAVRWAQGKPLTKKYARDEMVKIAAYEKKNYGFFEDTSAGDTAKLIREYFGTTSVSLKEDITVDDIIAELKKGNILIIPVHGQRVKNPYYTPPGPLEHMMVVRGYDQNTREVIVNDPGTRRGEGFRYPRDVFERAIQDYPSGFKEPIREVRKVMIVISKEKKK